jgi:RNA polymerase sigma-70 factor, ECF subfamily
VEEGRWTDDALVQRFRDGDVAAFETLVDRYGGPIYNFALRYLDSQPDAADVAQQTFIQAFESLPGLRAEVPLRPWLMRVARNKCIDLLRKRRTVSLPSVTRDEDATAFDPVDEAPLPEEIYEHAELQETLQEAINTLPPRSREVVLLRYVSGLTFAEAAENLGIPENTAKTLFQRAKVQLRAFLRKRL